MPVNPNMKAIQTVSVGAGGASAITFSSIPQTYTDLFIIWSARGARVFQYDSAQIRFNSDTGSNYSYIDMYMPNNGTTTTGNQTSRGIADRIYLTDVIPAANSTASTFSAITIHIPNYTSSAQKVCLIEAAGEANTTSTGDSVRLQLSGYWNNTSAINTISLAAYSANMAQYSSATLYGITNSAVGAKATGGIISEDNTYYYHTFTASGTFTPSQTLTADYLIIGGGGGGGAHAGYDVNYGGGGGAGGMRCTVTATGGGGSLESPVSLVSSTAYTITVGAGGASITNTRGGNSGNNSSIIGGAVSITAQRGGGGGSASGVSGEGDSGGSGGGGGGGASPVTCGAGTANQGYAGGSSAGVSGAPGGGGGGAGAAGANQGGGTIGGTGGFGVATIISGISTTYAGGGSGGGNGTSAQPGGLGGGGAGAIGTGNGSAGTINTGGGGGGSGRTTTSASGAGGSGIVIIRYAK